MKNNDFIIRLEKTEDYRAVENLVLLVNNWTDYISWSTLIRKVGLINEQ